MQFVSSETATAISWLFNDCVFASVVASPDCDPCLCSYSKTPIAMIRRQSFETKTKLVAERDSVNKIAFVRREAGIGTPWHATHMDGCICGIIRSLK